jgi:hypothetical protein
VARVLALGVLIIAAVTLHLTLHSTGLNTSSDPLTPQLIARLNTGSRQNNCLIHHIGHWPLLPPMVIYMLLLVSRLMG